MPSIPSVLRLSLLLLALAKIDAFAASPSPATSLSVDDDAVNPLGFYQSMPTFSWKLPAGVVRQTAYRIQTADADGITRWDSGWVNSDQSAFVPYGGNPLASRERLSWRVDFRDQDGIESGWSQPATLELGLLANSDWKAQWIRPAQDNPAGMAAAGCLRREFTVPTGKKIDRARVYVTARGLFELTLNGSRVGRDYFTPGFTAYDKRLDTLTYDVTAALRPGSNQLDALLGTGWYAGDYPGSAKKPPYGAHPQLLLQLEITYADGSRDTLVSDGQWQGAIDGPIVSSSIYNGEDYDARRRPTDWQPVQVDASLGSARLQPKPFASVRQVDALAVQTITEPQPGRYVFDLGQNMVGWARIRLLVKKDETVTLRFAEMLQQDGTLYTKNYRSAKSTDTYTAAADGVIDWQPHFTFHGFRYVELSGLPAGAKPQKDWVTGIVLHTDLATTGRFESSNGELNQLQSNITWGWRGNSLDIPTDCPQRNERLGWTGDADVFAATSMFNTDALAFWKSWLGSMRDDQDASGVIPDIIPSANVRFRRASPGWMDAAVVIPWDVYVRTGDTGILTDNYAMMQKLLAWYRSQSADGLLPKIKGYGDWLQPYQKNKRLTGDTPLPLLGAAFYARDAQILSDTARVLGRDDDARLYASEAARVRAAFAKHYFDADSKLQNSPETQTAYVLAIAFDLLPPPLKSKAGDHLARLVREAGTHLRTGFLGTPFITRALDETGHSDLAAALLFQKTYPSWFYSIDQGATTLWERWNSYSIKDGFGDASMNSFNHYAYGAIGQWMYERVAGLAPDPAHPGYKHIIVHPLFVPQLKSARAALQTPYGQAIVEWEKQGTQATVAVFLPPNTTATFIAPDGRKTEIRPSGSPGSSMVVTVDLPNS